MCPFYAYDIINYNIVQIRLLFNRKNKTLRSVLMTRSVLKLLDENRKTVLSLNNTGQKMDTSSTTATTTANRSDAERTIQEILEDILEQEQWRNQRASKLDLDDFLQLLVEFNSRGIHFS